MNIPTWLKNTRICKSCGIEIDNGWLGKFHEEECKDKVLGYDLYNEKITPETKLYFFNQKRQKHD